MWFDGPVTASEQPEKCKCKFEGIEYEGVAEANAAFPDEAWHPFPECPFYQK